MHCKLDQIILFCADVKKLSSFYQTYFGLKPVGDQGENWALLTDGAIKLAFHQIGKKYRSGSPENFKVESNTKLVFEIDSDLTSFQKQLKEEKVAIGDIKQFPGADYIVCDGTDPEGNVFQLKQTIQQLTANK